MDEKLLHATSCENKRLFGDIRTLRASLISLLLMNIKTNNSRFDTKIYRVTLTTKNFHLKGKLIKDDNFRI